MAINNPSNLYTAGAVVFDTRPSTNFAIQLLQQKKAKDEALDQYYQKLPSTINEAGMRDQDREPFMQNIGALQAYWRDNRDKIKNPRRDGGAAQYNYEKMFRDISTRVNMSKQAAKTDLELGKLRFSENTSYIFDDPEIIDRIGKQSLSVWDPQHQTVDLATITVPPKPMAQKDWDEYWKGLPGSIKPSENTEYKPDPADRFSRIPVTTIAYDKKQLEQIGINAAESYVKNKRLRTEFNKSHALTNIASLEDWKEDHEALYNQLNAPFKAVYGTDISSPAELHAAEAIQRYGAPQVKTGRPVVNTAARFDAEQAEQNARQARTLAAQRANKEAGSSTGPIGNVLNTIQVGGGQQNGWYTMGAGGNKQNLASIQQLLGDNVMKLSSINGTAANDPRNRVEYLVENGEVKAIRYKGLVYDRDYFERAQKQLDKNPQWEGKLRYPEQQQTGSGHYSPNKGKNTSSKNNDPLGLGL